MWLLYILVSFIIWIIFLYAVKKTDKEVDVEAMMYSLLCFVPFLNILALAAVVEVIFDSAWWRNLKYKKVF